MSALARVGNARLTNVTDRQGFFFHVTGGVVSLSLVTSINGDLEPKTAETASLCSSLCSHRHRHRKHYKGGGAGANCSGSTHEFLAPLPN